MHFLFLINCDCRFNKTSFELVYFNVLLLLYNKHKFCRKIVYFSLYLLRIILPEKKIHPRQSFLSFCSIFISEFEDNDSTIVTIRTKIFPLMMQYLRKIILRKQTEITKTEILTKKNFY